MVSTVCQAPPDYPPEILGYADPWIVSPGDQVDIKVSSTAPEYRYRAVRLTQGIKDPSASDVEVENVPSIKPGIAKGRFQKAHPGSYAYVDNLGLTSEDDGLEISLYMQPFLVRAQHDQVLLSLGERKGEGDIATSLNVLLNADAILTTILYQDGAEHEVTVDCPLINKQWYKVVASLCENSVGLSIEPVMHLGCKRGQNGHSSLKLQAPISLPTEASLGIAARASHDTLAGDFFNGRIEAVNISTNGKRPRDLVKLDFSLQMSTDQAIDVSGQGNHAVLVNAPTRAVRGHDWDGSETDWTKASYGYGPIHFHEDDLDDACWETDVTITIPAGLRSGAYAVEAVSCEDASVKDSIVFFVRPSPASTAKVAMVLSTFTYAAYANERMYDQTRSSRLALPEPFKSRNDEDLARMQRRSDLGLSLYDVHLDGSGTVFSSTKRPILNVRPWFQHWALDRPREFSADMLMIGLLEKLGVDYDVTTDHDLHTQGVGALRAYNAIITGSHPEYPTVQSLAAYNEFSARGGNIMYLGGNGFYWMSVVDSARPHRLEVRRGDQGLRHFELPGGERHHSLNGAQGGMWRSRGRSANYLVGVGCCAEGLGPGVPYRRTEAASKDDFAWVFAGVAESELVGEHGFAGGASGDEVDRWDPANGSPPDAVVLASSTGHSDLFALFPEDLGFQDTQVLGTQTNRIRSDMVIHKTPSGGSIFSVGSMNWNLSLAWNSYQNNVARITENVVRKFAANHCP